MGEHDSESSEETERFVDQEECALDIKPKI